jgi:hypothetical protein
MALKTILAIRNDPCRKLEPFRIVAQVREPENSSADDFVVSGKLASLMLSQVSESADLHVVFRGLFSSDGAEIYMKPASLYLPPDQRARCSEIARAARERGEISLGYRKRNESNIASGRHRVWLNPDRAEEVSLSESDAVIVLAAS